VALTEEQAVQAFAAILGLWWGYLVIRYVYQPTMRWCDRKLERLFGVRR
jgi:hypothetical protein